MRILLLAFITAFSVNANAGIFDDIVDAIGGHITDVTDRINHEDQHVSGNTLSASEFRDTDPGRDSVHWANGGVSLIDRDGVRHIQLDTDFATGPAPDLYIYIANKKVVDEKSFWEADATELSKLKSGSGAQHYELPAGFSTDNLEIIIWCKRFGEYIGAATLK